MVGKYFLIWRMKRQNIENIYYNFLKLRQWFEVNLNNIFFLAIFFSMYGYWQTEMWFLSQEGKMHDQPKLVGYGNQLAWNCLLLACMKIEHFHHKNSFYSHSCAFRYKKYSIKIYRGSSKSICNLRYMLSITCVFYPISIGLLIKLKQDA